MSINLFLQQIKAYYNKEGLVISMNYKGHPISTTGSTEASVYKSIVSLMAFVDFVKKNKINRLTTRKPHLKSYDYLLKYIFIRANHS